MEKPETKLEAERWKDVASKLLENRDLLGSKRFAKRAQDLCPQVDGVDQIISIIDVLLAAEKRINNHFDWYAILQLDCRSNDLEAIRRQYRKLCLLLHPDKNKSVFADNAFKLVCDAWAFLSDSSKKFLYDKEYNLCKKFDPIVLRHNQPKPPPAKAAAPPPPPPPPQQMPQQTQTQTPVRRSVREKRKTAKSFSAEVMAEMEDTTTTQDDNNVQDQAQNGNAAQAQAQAPSRLSTFWTTCPYCYHLYEYPGVYKDCCLRCQNCRRGFHAVVVASPPPAVGPERDMYYCCWAFFPIGYTTPGNVGKNSNWTPFTEMFAVPSQPGEVETEDRMASRNDSLREDDLVDNRSGKKGRTENLSNKIMKEKNFTSSQAELVKEGSGNVGTSKDVQGGSGANTVDSQKTLRVKTTARKSIIKPKPNNQIPTEVQNKSVGGKSNPDWVGMDLNLELRPETEEPYIADGVGGIEIGSIDKEATEGIGFFEGLDDILGNLPILSVPGAQKPGNAR
ncbi:Chaperone dnaj-domain superfamily protein [Thalictrum thalictroides]|uniref:Chaperone dnaj-domain superfamily protein n=1 Tax=Thalictrum thalictroides TaxID=46969 RepID=A0A7J6XAE7_THATH|nr:Chaperone dnaj-domain superfamily protein [Thalictrum thalictroides]